MRNRESFQDEYPFRSRFFDQKGYRYHYIDEGAGEPLLMVHGNPTWNFAWRNLIKELSWQYRVLAVDHIGCGLSDKPSHYKYVLKQHIDNLSRFVDSLDLRGVTLFAHDWGGPIGLGTALRLPDRFERFVLMNTGAFRSPHIPLRIALCRIPVLGDVAVRGLNLFAQAALWMAVEQRERMTPAVKAGYLAPYDGWANRVAILRFVQDIPRKPNDASYATLAEIEEGLESLSGKPVLLIWGTQDWCFTTEFLEEFQRRFPSAETLTFDEAGHYVFEDAHEIMLPRIRQFLEGRPLSEEAELSPREQ